VIECAGADPAAPPARKARSSNYDGVVDLVAERVKTSKGKITAKRLLPVARTAGYQRSARNFRRLVATQKRLWRNGHHRGRRPAVWTPGEYLVIDWTPVGAGLHVFYAVLPWSRWRLVWFAVDEKATTTMGFFAEACAAAGGVPTPSALRMRIFLVGRRRAVGG
jgi:transposase